MTIAGEGLQTFSSAHLRRQRERHKRVDGYGRHRHLYLHARMARVAQRLRSARPGCRLTWLDYGCGKGEFIRQIRELGLFDEIVGFDPAVSEFTTRPAGRFDLVTCLDVLDVVEPRFTDQVLFDISSLTGGLFLFDCLTLPKRESALKPHSLFYWHGLIQRHMNIVESGVEFAGIQDFERAVILAASR